MKANKKHLTNQIESILANGICDMEEIDITSEKLIKLIWPYFEYYEDQNKELIEVLEDLMKGINGLPPLTAIQGVLEKQYEKAKKSLKK